MRGRINEDDQVEYSDSKNKVTATVKGHTSAKYTKLAKNIKKIQELQKEIEVLEEEAKADARSTISDLFKAEDEVKTRVVDTVSFTLTLSKTPEPTQTVAYAKVMKELEGHLTPELIEVLEDLKAKFTTTVQKQASLKMVAKESIDLEEGVIDKLKDYFKKFLNTITNWCTKYDTELDKLKQEVGM